MAGWTLLPGGYLGVDIFFVISGYLITTLLMNELTQTGRVSIFGFYERRARRLLPALLLVMLASLPFAWHYLLPEQLVDFSQSLLFSLFFTSNFYWDMSLQQYGAESSLLKPFLHTWSLAVEEQYYIVFPLLLMSLYRWGRRHLAKILCAGLLVSLGYAHWVTGHDQSFSFYMVTTRFWELLTGSMLALYLINRPQIEPRTRLHKALPSVGLLMIFASLVSFHIDIHHPGLVTLLPVMGTALVIGFSLRDEPVNRALSQSAMVYFGLLSYSLYLWHYPIFAFGRMADMEPGIVTKVFWIILTIVLSVCSYHWLEKPFRNRRRSRALVFSSLLAASAIVVVVAINGLEKEQEEEKDAPAVVGSYLTKVIKSSRQIRVSQDGAKCNSGERARNWFGVADSCVFEYYPGSPTLVLIGDSNAAAIGNSVRQLAKENQYNFAQVTQMGCPHLRVSDLSKDTLNCFQRAAQVSAFLKTLERPIIVYNARLPIYFQPVNGRVKEGELRVDNAAVKTVRQKLQDLHPEKPSRAVGETLGSWIEAGYPLAIVYPVPEQGFNVVKRLKWHKPTIENADQMPTFSTSYQQFKKRARSSYAALDAVVGANVVRVYPEQLFCREDTGLCMASEHERLYFETDSHVTPLGSDMIVRELAGALKLKVPKSFRE